MGILATNSGLTASGLSRWTVDQALGTAVLLMTGKLLRIYAFNALTTGRQPDRKQFKTYLSGTAKTPALDFYSFPRLFGDLSDIQSAIIGSPMYGPSGMFLALALLSARPKDVTAMLERLRQKKPLMDPEAGLAAMLAAYS